MFRFGMLHKFLNAHAAGLVQNFQRFNTKSLIALIAKRLFGLGFIQTARKHNGIFNYILASVRVFTDLRIGDSGLHNGSGNHVFLLSVPLLGTSL